jgi:hypothetical protein
MLLDRCRASAARDLPRTARERIEARRVAADVVEGPAIALMLVGVAGLVIPLASVLTRVVAQPSPTTGLGALESLGSAAVLILGIFWAFVVALGGLHTKCLLSRDAAIAGAIMAMIPASWLWVFGLPLGIWALRALRKPGVRGSFAVR